MAQIQGQLAITGLPWCNFLAVCKNTKEIMLKKVYFHSEYWDNVVKILKQFCYALQVSSRFPGTSIPQVNIQSQVCD